MGGRSLLLPQAARAEAPEPAWVEYAASFFPVLLVVFLLRSFVAEPFKIPSSSMRPTLEVGDFILVNKFTYGLRLPIVEAKFLPLGEPQRGDVVVFRYPVNPSQDFIKRVVGVGGDVVTLPGQEADRERTAAAAGARRHLRLSREPALRDAREVPGDGAQRQRRPTSTRSASTRRRRPSIRRTCDRFPGRDNCDYNDRGFTCKVPPGHYFMMGDNRDNSDDSRYWGFVPDDHIRGKAFFIWFNWDDISSLAFKRVGSGHPVTNGQGWRMTTERGRTGGSAGCR